MKVGAKVKIQGKKLLPDYGKDEKQFPEINVATAQAVASQLLDLV